MRGELLGRCGARAFLDPLHRIIRTRCRSGSAQQAETDLHQIARREWWLWLSALFVTALSALAFLLTSFRSFFLRSNHFYEIRSDQARWGILCLLLLFNGWSLYRQRFFRRQRRQLTHQGDAPEASSNEIFHPSGVHPVTGLYPRSFAAHPPAE